MAKYPQGKQIKIDSNQTNKAENTTEKTNNKTANTGNAETLKAESEKAAFEPKVERKIIAPIEQKSLDYGELFIVFMQALAVTASFIPMLLGPTAPALVAFVGASYPMWIVFGVFAVEFLFWFNINYGPKQESKTKTQGAKKGQRGPHEKETSIKRDLGKLYVLVENVKAKGEGKDEKYIKAVVTSMYLQKRYDYLKDKLGVTKLNANHLASEKSFTELYEALDKNTVNNRSEIAILIDGKEQDKNLKEYIEGTKVWKAIVAKHASKVKNNKPIRKVFEIPPLVAKFLPESLLDSDYSKTIEYVADKLGIAAALFGNAVGCAGSAFMLTALMKSIPLFVPMASIYAPILLTPVLPITMTAVLFGCGYYAHFCNTVPAIKQAMKEMLYRSAGKTETEDSPFKSGARAIVLGFSYFAAIVMAGAISTINFLTGKFFGWLALNAGQILVMSPASMATLAAPTTGLGLALGGISAAVTFIGLICLFSKYVPGGILGLFEAVWEAVESVPGKIAKVKKSMTLQNLKDNLSVQGLKDTLSNIPTALLYVVSFLAVTSFVTVVTSFATLSICYFVGAVIGQQWVSLTAVCGTAMYFNQSLDVGNKLFGIKALNGYCTKASDFAKTVAPCMFSATNNTHDDDKSNEFAVFAANTISK